jgi:hypothetical protein
MAAIPDVNLLSTQAHERARESLVCFYGASPRESQFAYIALNVGDELGEREASRP